MKLEKTYYSISEVAKLLGIYEHTIRFWDSKLPNLSTRSEKGKSRFFNKKQIEKIAQINNLLKNNDTISLAYEIASKRNYRGQSSSAVNYSTKVDSKYSIENTKILSILNNLKQLLKS